MIFSDRKSSTGNSPSTSPKLAQRKGVCGDEFLNNINNENSSENSYASVSSQGSPRLHLRKSPKIPSSLATESKTLEGTLNLVAPIAVTEELDGDDGDTTIESDINEGI